MRVGSSGAERRQHAGENDGPDPHSAAPWPALLASMLLLSGHGNERGRYPCREISPDPQVSILVSPWSWAVKPLLLGAQPCAGAAAGGGAGGTRRVNGGT